ncbi:ATP-binding cassette domain-containing protein [Algoriphagus sp. CAU 1675]|uniref:ATP-binding cassette domain-containing protein n=1 Tax=Algoriphagus sp. CAU 1675 TaxID=3032597 RepID=UPI0023DBDB11|nr:ATP-binding cassette domain-containing protein [Algoriphagus sp. CAU 1675]MDF2158380.1 ATP-binding cassette domain-containing protein [Algoriphagus sp. CAU 1675]
MQNPLIQVQQAKVLFKGQQAFESLDFNWSEGQHWAIIGDSGWKLTAFLETLRGNTVVSSGEILRPFATDYNSLKTAQKEVHSFRDLMAYVSQKYEFRNRFNQQDFYFQQRFNSSESEETATVSEFLKDVQAKVQGPWTLEKVIKLMRLEQLRDESLLKLSNGETRRLALAAGLLRQPSIYLMDQPMTGLDVGSRTAFGEILKEMIQEGIHVLLTASADEIPDGISHIAQINSEGIGQSWERNVFHGSGQDVQIKSWDWDLLRSLLPSNSVQKFSPVKLEKVRISYDGKSILDAIDWEIKAGERWLLKGPNGSGKSTLISLLIGENPQSYSQNIWLFGRKRGTGESIWDVKRPTGFVAPELSRYFPSNQTCRKVILSGLFDTMGLFKKVTPDQENLAQQWIQLFELENLAELPLSRLSLEHQRWTLLARALIKKPDLLILDEASQGMDELQRRLFKSTVQKICELSSVSLIYVSHYAEDIPEAVDLTYQL